MREINILEQDIRCCDDLYVDIDCINITYELWFDVDKYFGTNISKDDDTWINFYTYWYPNGDIRAIYEIDTGCDITSYDWDLTNEEKQFFFNKMENYCRKITEKSLIELWNEYQ